MLEMWFGVDFVKVLSIGVVFPSLLPGRVDLWTGTTWWGRGWHSLDSYISEMCSEIKLSFQVIIKTVRILQKIKSVGTHLQFYMVSYLGIVRWSYYIAWFHFFNMHKSFFLKVHWHLWISNLASKIDSISIDLNIIIIIYFVFIDFLIKFLPWTMVNLGSSAFGLKCENMHRMSLSLFWSSLESKKWPQFFHGLNYYSVILVLNKKNVWVIV